MIRHTKEIKMNITTESDALLAERYRWLCQTGWKHPVFNHPRVIHEFATASEIDDLIQKGMKKWPTKSRTPDHPPSHVA